MKTVVKTIVKTAAKTIVKTLVKTVVKTAARSHRTDAVHEQRENCSENCVRKRTHHFLSIKPPFIFHSSFHASFHNGFHWALRSPLFSSHR